MIIILVTCFRSAFIALLGRTIIICLPMAVYLLIVIRNTDMELPILLTNHSNEKFSVDSHCRQSTRQVISFKQQRDSYRTLLSCIYCATLQTDPLDCSWQNIFWQNTQYFCQEHTDWSVGVTSDQYIGQALLSF